MNKQRFFLNNALPLCKQEIQVMEHRLMSDDRNSSGSFASSALRSLLNLLPINIGYGFNATGHDRSDVTDDEEII